MWKLNSYVLNNNLVGEEIKKLEGFFLEFYENKGTAYPNYGTQ